MRLDRESCLLLIVDIQSRLAPAMHDPTPIIQTNAALIYGARALEVPIIASEHCAERIGPTVPELRVLLRNDEIVAKRSFSCADDSNFQQKLRASGRKQILVTGMEAHVCVLQTVLGLMEQGYEPLFVADATASRRTENKQLAMERLRQETVRVVSTEMVLFEWLGHADHPAFRETLQLIKNL